MLKNKSNKSTGPLLRKKYVRRPKTKLDKVMAGIALYEHLEDVYPPVDQIVEAFEHNKLEPSAEINKVLLKEFIGIELPAEFLELEEKE